MSLTGLGLRIIVSEPYESNHVNLFGHVLKEHKNSILINLSMTIKGNRFSSNLFLLQPRYQGETFKPLLQHLSVTLSGTLVHPETNETDFILIGTVTIDY